MKAKIKQYLIIACAFFLTLLSVYNIEVLANEEKFTDDWIIPVEGIVTDLFGARNGTHKGVDIASEYGSPVRAVSKGIVKESYYSQSYGNVIFIKHDDHDVETVYAHLSKRLVSEGDEVTQGMKIGEVGSTGRSSGAHLHFEIHDGPWNYDKSNAINPALVYDDLQHGSELVFNEKLLTELKSEKLTENDRLKLKLFEDNLVYLSKEAGKDLSISDSQATNFEHEITYTVAAGDTLWEIANLYGVQVDEIIKTNQLLTSTIYPDQTLIIKKQLTKDFLIGELLVKKIKQSIDERRTVQMLQMHD